MGEYVQDGRIISIHTPLGADKLLLQSFTGKEGISQLFRFDCECLSEDAAINYDDIIGKKVTIRLATNFEDTPRYFNGVCSRFWQVGKDDRFTHYRVEVVPWLWFLSRTSNCRIFQNKSVGDIISQVFSDQGFQDFTPEHSNNPTLEYCVQYRETDLNFVSRLMEQYGISYFFRHEEQKHILVLADGPSFPKPCPNQATARYHTTTGGFVFEEDVVTGMQVGKEVRPGKYTLNDFNFETPMVDLTASTTGNDSRRYEIYDYPGEYKTKSEGDTLAAVRLDEEETPTTVVRASSTCRFFVSGFRFDLQEHYRGDLNNSYVLTEVQHSATVGQNYYGGQSAEQEHYFNYFVAVPFPVKFRPPRLTPRPIISGPQTAIVTGPPGEEIYVDKYGRVKVQFHWDREGKYDDKSSCWVRVSHAWAGKQWGAIYIPRIGQEVIVEFEEGDPDHPIITGRVYNAESMPPYKLPDHQTKSTVKSYSSKGGGGFNEFRFEDKKGSEQIFFNAQKDYDLRVKATRKEITGGDQHLIVKHDLFEKIENDTHQTIKGDHNMKTDGTVSLTVGKETFHKTGTRYAIEAGQEVHVKAGMNLILEAGMTVTLKGPGGFITINPGGVFISGTMVMINSGGSAQQGSGCNPEAPKDPLEADTAEPGQKPQMPPPKPPRAPGTYSPGAVVLKEAAANGTPFCDI